ncbi:hypothetical protein [Ralstonia pseudosolanacearum]|uniref:hypothetical protein n=1 Tax=Ralstonia pseudosolanacearum TaxID=1310165 RepID=UPI001FFAB388|nr:hypothetical protein [Ralstonia pseudosolanacearum]
MAAKRVSKKKYLKILNKRLRSETGASSSAMFIFSPPGAKAKHATGIAASEQSNERELEVMAAVQHKASSEFVVTEEKAA